MIRTICLATVKAAAAAPLVTNDDDNDTTAAAATPPATNAADAIVVPPALAPVARTNNQTHATKQDKPVPEPPPLHADISPNTMLPHSPKTKDG